MGLYYPFRDIYAETNPNGIPFKNFLVTDPVRQTYPWKFLAINIEKNLELPLWNPYNFSGTPLLANFQTGAFYIFNIIFFILPFSESWTLFILIQPILAGAFMYLFLKNLRLKRFASFIGSISFAFGGFSIAWLEWGNVVHTALWLPLLLLSIDKVVEYSQKKSKLPDKRLLTWSLTFLGSLTFSFFAGHLQIFFYIAIVSLVYLLVRLFEIKTRVKILFLFSVISLIFLTTTFIQWFPTLQFISLSARNTDLIGYTAPGWFIPWQNLVQFIAPDFFGNPSTLNYYGVWNYAEFVGYIGILPLVAAIFALYARRDKNTLFFFCLLIISLVLALPNPISKVPYIIDIPFLSTSQPTRLIFVITFSLSALAALGLDLYSRQKKGMFYVLLGVSVVFAILWTFIIVFKGGGSTSENIIVTRQNLILPTLIFALVFVLFLIWNISVKFKNKIIYLLLVSFVIGITTFDLFRFGWKFEPFTNREYLFPDTKITEFLQKNIGNARVSFADSQIFPPNFSIMYKLQTVDGYDPLYIKRYGEFAAAFSRSSSDISAPFGFNRIITLQNIKSKLSDFLGIKYFLAFEDPDDNKLIEVFSDGKLTVYENVNAYDRAFFVSSTVPAKNKQDSINLIMDPETLLKDVAIVEEVGDLNLSRSWSKGKALIKSYSENKVVIETANEGEGFLVLTDSYYPIWRAKIDGIDSRIYLTDFAFRGIIVPEGNHAIEFYTKFLK